MTLNVLFAAISERYDQYFAPLTAAFEKAGLGINLSDTHQPDVVDYIVYAPNSPVQDFTPYTRCKAVLNLWAGVEAVVNNPTLKVPLTRMVDHGLTRGMVEWVTAQTLRHHLNLDLFIHGQSGEWLDHHTAPLAQDRTVCMLGLGELGRVCAETLRDMGFHMRGWARSEKTISGVKSYHGEDGLKDALSGSDIVILLLPDTPATENILNAQTLSYLNKGAYVINPGRGPLIDDQALIAALDSRLYPNGAVFEFRDLPIGVQGRVCQNICRRFDIGEGKEYHILGHRAICTRHDNH
ncbi:MAG: glyoxylate/hydroxypyruvate reductase A [Rhodobacteraceae bacterium]|nr:glyoxylate/hydroxypyruvate reductase A [Paracoccaceae bacterium]